MKTQELVIEIRVPLPEDRVENAKAIIAADAFEKALVNTAAEAFGENGYHLASRTVTRVPGRGKHTNGAEKPARGRKNQPAVLPEPVQA